MKNIICDINLTNFIKTIKFQNREAENYIE